jgi:branched-chain amino acid transport system substrate-binding protein
MRHLLAACCLALATAALPAAETVRIVSSLPLTGSANTQCTSMVNGIRMAIEEAGAKVTIAGTTYDLVYDSWDDASAQAGKWDAQVEGANARKAIADPDVLVYIGTYNSGAAKVSMPTLNAAGLAMISPANTWPGLTKPGIGEANEPTVYRPSGTITYFRVVPADDLQGAVGAAWAKEMGAQRVFILHDRELYGQGIAKMFKLNAEKLGLTVVGGMEGIDGKASNYKALVTKIRAANVDLVYFGGTTETGAGQLAKDLAGAGVKAKLMGPDAFFNSALMSAAGDAALEERVFVTFGGVPPEQQTGKGKAFVDAYQAKYGQMPEGYAIYAYECAKVAIDAMGRAKAKDRSAVVAAIAATRDFDGALGRWSFDVNGDTTLTVMSGNTVRGGQFQFVKLLGQ